MSIQQFCLRWNNHQPNFISVFTTLLNTESLVDVTLAAEGKHLQAHKVVLSACSVYFQTLFTANPSRHPIVILKDVKYADLRIMVDFMYYGEVNVSQEQLPQILETAKMLKIKGLTEMPESTSLTKSQSTSSADLLTPGESSWESQRHSISPCNLSPSVKRKRFRKTSTGSCSTNTLAEQRVNEEKGYDPSGASLDLVKSDSITLSSLPQQRRKEAYHEFGKESDENGAIDATLQQSTEETSNSLSVDPLTMENAPGLTQHVKSLPQIKQTTSTGSRRGKQLLRQERVRKESEGTSETSPLTRCASEPPIVIVTEGLPPTTHPELRKYASHPPLLKVRRQGKLMKIPVTHVQAELIVSSPAVSSLSIESTAGEVDELTNTQGTTRARHCPAVRTGPALSCNFCWNTVDELGRILRRKTKYHCPECRANLCIVPCFHEYHASGRANYTEDIPAP